MRYKSFLVLCGLLVICVLGMILAPTELVRAWFSIGTLIVFLSFFVLIVKKKCDALSTTTTPDAPMETEDEKPVGLTINEVGTRDDSQPPYLLLSLGESYCNNCLKETGSWSGKLRCARCDDGMTFCVDCFRCKNCGAECPDI